MQRLLFWRMQSCSSALSAAPLPAPLPCTRQTAPMAAWREAQVAPVAARRL